MKTIIVDYEPKFFQSIEPIILSNCPNLKISGYATSSEEAFQLITHVNPTLVIMEVSMPDASAFQILNSTIDSDFKTIIVAHSCEHAFEAIKYQVSGYILKPLDVNELTLAIKLVEDSVHAINKKKNERKINEGYDKKLLRNLIGIPSIGGFDFLRQTDVIRCEGFQRCTRIVTKDKSDIISSYHIGFFKERFNYSCFYSPHKSHLINLIHIEKYLKEGTIKMVDGSFVPVSKRRKNEFLKLMELSR